MIKEPIILIFEGAPIEELNKIHAELHRIFEGTKYEDHFFITNKMVKGLENPYLDKLDEIIELLSKPYKNTRKIFKDD